MFIRKPSRRVKKATVKAARSERPKVSSKALSVVHLMNSPPVLHSNAAPSTRKSGEAFAAAPLLCDCSTKFCLSSWLKEIHHQDTKAQEDNDLKFQIRNLRSIFLCAFVSWWLTFRFLRAKVLAIDAVPGRNDDGDCAGDLRLTRQANQRLRLIRRDVAELFDSSSFEPRDIRELFRSAENAHPTCAA